MSGAKISDTVLEQMRKGTGLDRGIAAAIDTAVAAAVAEEREKYGRELQQALTRIANLEAEMDRDTVPRWQCDALVAEEREACEAAVDAVFVRWARPEHGLLRGDVRAAIRARGKS